MSVNDVLPLCIKKIENMHLKKEVLEKINNVKSRLALAMELEVTEQSIIKAINKNADNGPLTKFKAMQTIARLTGVSKHADLLSKKVVNAKV